MRRRTIGRQWRKRLIAGLMIVTLVILAGVAVFTYSAYRRTAAELVMERDQQLTYFSAARLKDELAKHAEVLAPVARLPEIARGDTASRRTALNRARFRLAVFDGGVVLLDNFGKIRAAEPERPELLGNDWSGKDIFRETLVSRQAHFSEVSLDGPGAVPVVAVSVPLLGDNGEFLGVLAGMFRLGKPTVSSFYASIVRLRIGQTGETLLLDGNGRVLYDSSYKLVGQSWDMSRLTETGPQGGAVRLLDATGNDVIATYATVPGTRWTLMSEDEWAVATGPLRRYGNILIALLALSFVLPMAGVALLLREQNAEVIEQERTEQDARVAGLIRQRLIPRQVPMLAGWSVAVHYHPADEAAGDFHDFAFLPDGAFMLAVGDVSATGVLGAQVMSTARATLRGAANRGLPPAEALELSNRLLYPEIADAACMSCLYAILDPIDGRLSFANAGFNAPIVRSDLSIRALEPIGPRLGEALDARYQAGQVSVAPGEFLFLFSDGLMEARNALGETFGVSRLRKILESHDGDAQAVVHSVVSELERFIGKGWSQRDDLTVIVLERNRNGS